MLALLLVATFAVLALWCAGQQGWRESVLTAALVTATVLVWSSELLSLAGLLSGPPVAAVWGMCLGIAVSGCRRRRHAIPRPKLLAFDSGLSVVAFVAIVSIMGVLLVIALVAPPNNWDSMTYHMARVVHWVQNRSLGFYSTNIIRQLFMMPGAAYVILHLDLLAGGDRLANVVQWAAMAGCLTGTSLIAQELGSGVRGQWMTALFVVTVPMGILQATSTQNDLVVAFWLVCLAYWILRSRRTGISRGNAAAIGSSLGLALLTKGTSYVYATPLLTWLLWILFRREKPRMWKAAVMVVAAVISLNAGHWMRNMMLTGKPIGAASTVNTGMGPRLLASNIVRGLAIHAAVPFSAWNSMVERKVAELHQFLGVPASDPNTTFMGFPFDVDTAPGREASPWARDLKTVLRHEDHAPNPLHLMLLLVAIPAVVCRRGLAAMYYAAAVCSAFLLFCLVLKWQPWVSRLHLPLFILAAPLFGIAVDKFRRTWLSGALAFLLVAQALPNVLLNTTRPLIGAQSILRRTRMDQYLSSRPELEVHYRDAVRVIGEAGWTRLGLITAGDSGEYPLWMFLEERIGHAFRMEHVDVDDPSDRFDRGWASGMEAVICLDRLPSPGFVQRSRLREVWASGPIRILVVDPSSG